MEMTEPRLIDRREIYDGRVVDLRLDTVRMPNGRTAELEIIRHRGAAAVVPLTSSGEVLLVRQYRHATGSWLLEVPAGKLERGEQPIACARREVEEEVAVKAGELVELGVIWTTPGFTDERIWLYLATGLEPGEQALEADEALTVERRPIADALGAVHSGEICDSKSMIALLRAAHYLETASG
jgi:ADP-ribose pyrophosphatase